MVILVASMTDVNTTETTMQGVKQPVCKPLAMQVQRKPVCYFENVCCPNNMVYLALDCMDRYFLITLYVHNNSRDWDVSVQSGPSSGWTQTFLYSNKR